MTRHINLSLALILGLAAALNTTPLFAMQDEQCPDIAEEVLQAFGFETDCASDFFFGLQFAVGREAGSPEALYDVQFFGESDNETGAYIPERFNSEAMVVRVLAGSFAFRVQGPGVIVDPQGQSQSLERYEASIPIGLGVNPNIEAANVQLERNFAEVGEFICDLDLNGHLVCLFDQEEVEEFKDEVTFIRLDPGDTVYLPSNSTCFLCNTERIDPTGQVDPTVPAELLIWSSTTGFSGALENPPQVNSQGMPAMQGSGMTAGWMLNPGSNCK